MPFRFLTKIFGWPDRRMMAPVDPEKRTALIEEIKRQGLPVGGSPLPVVALEAFFEGNSDLGSIGCNLLEHPGTEVFFGVLREIRARPEVQDILIEIYEVEEFEESMWPFSERVYIYTTASDQTILEWLEALGPDELIEGYTQGKHPDAPNPGTGYRVVGAWWD